jgi:GTP-binding protein EngB required for normal cell division
LLTFLFIKEAVTKQQLTSQELDDVIKAKIAEGLIAQRQKPFIISIMGQTGVGKSSLINALFNTKLPVSAISPTTKEMKPIDIKNGKGHTITFYDMPGIGESEKADETYLTSYREQLLASDVVIWAIHADNRSTAFDVQKIKSLLDGVDTKERCLLMSKITFVLTKTDLIMQEPWIAGCIDGYATFSPGTKTRSILKEKALYYEKLFIHPYGSDIIARTYHNGTFTSSNTDFAVSERSVYYHGHLTREMVEKFKKEQPQHSEIFEGLYDNYRVIPCSAQFRYNLPELLLVIMNKLGPNVFESFKRVINVYKQSIDIELLDQVQFEKMLNMCNLCIIDVQRKKKMFDLGSSVFPDETFNNWFHSQIKKKHSWFSVMKNSLLQHNK